MLSVPYCIIFLAFSTNGMFLVAILLSFSFFKHVVQSLWIQSYPVFSKRKQVTKITDVDVSVGPESDQFDGTIWNSANDEEVTSRFLSYIIFSHNLHRERNIFCVFGRKITYSFSKIIISKTNLIIYSNLRFLATRGFKAVYCAAVPHFGADQFTLISQPHQNVKVRFLIFKMTIII